METTPLAEISDLEPVDADNIARFPEGQKVPTLNNGARALEGILARYFADTNGTIVATGTAPNYAVATSRAIPSLVDGVVVVWRAHAAFASGTATLTVNALTQKNLVTQGGGALVVGDIAEDQTVLSRYNSDMDAFECLGIPATASDTVKGSVKVSTQAIMETGTATDAAVLVGHQHFHPGHPKCWGYASGGASPALVTSYNITSITDEGTGDITFTIGVDFSSANWCSVGTGANTSEGRAVVVKAKAAGSVRLLYKAPGEGATDPDQWNFVGFGDQA